MAATAMLFAPLVVLLLFIPGLTPQSPTASLTAQEIMLATQDAETAIRALKAQTIPDISGRNHKISEIRINDVTLPSIQVSPASSQQLILSANNAGVKVSARYYAKKWFIRARGRIEGSVTGLDLTVRFSTAVDGAGKIRLTVHSCQSSVRDVKLKFKGGLFSWVINLFRGKLERKVESIIPDKLCDAVRKAVRKPLGRR